MSQSNRLSLVSSRPTDSQLLRVSCGQNGVAAAPDDKTNSITQQTELRTTFVQSRTTAFPTRGQWIPNNPIAYTTERTSFESNNKSLQGIFYINFTIFTCKKTVFPSFL